ncbi:ABC transporter permease [Rugosimonospora africana]|uniref:Transport permease protein n=1 Tax=Rugosimonospora africana TaxID=556532 RepID=A0A8J3R2E6_9ACTN|nr:ABC transporter permease [Rugosimonospora africana]GIH21016.1 transport permease protein [Rugosimonospora africana]
MLRETWLIVERQLLLLRRSPAWMITGVLQPALYLVLFAPLLKTALHAGSTGQAYETFVPGLLVMLALYSTLFAGFTLIGEQRAGVLERHRVTPVSRQALLLGRCLREVISLLFQASVIVVFGLPFGLSVSIGDLLLVYLLLGLVALLMSMLSYAAALRLRSEDALGPVLNTVTQPLLLLSGVLLPITAASAPAWLLDISRVNPMTWTVDAVRALFAGDHADRSIWVAVVTTVVLTAVVQVWVGRLFVRSVR